MEQSSTTEDDILISSTKTSKVLSSYTLDLKSVITNNVDNIIDFQFLHGYTQPTLGGFQLLDLIIMELKSQMTR